MNSKIVSLVGVVAVLSLMMLCVDASYKHHEDKRCNKDSDCCDRHKNKYICVKSRLSGHSRFSKRSGFMNRRESLEESEEYSKQGTCVKCDDVKSICSSHVQSWNYHGHPEPYCYWLKCKCGMECPGTTPSPPTTTPMSPSTTSPATGTPPD